MDAESHIVTSRQGRVLRITLNRPDDRNCIVAGMLEQVADAVEAAMSDPAVGAVLLIGAGRDFCAGGSLRSLAASGHADVGVDEQTRRALAATRSAKALSGVPKPTIAALRGAVAGGGLALAAACDMRIVARGARISFAYSRIGLSGDIGATLYLSRLLGPRMSEFALLSPIIGAEEAVSLGLAGRLVEDDALDDEAADMANGLANLSPLAAAAIKQNLAAARELPEADALAIEAENFARCQRHPDHALATRAFVQKTAPSFDYSNSWETAAWPHRR